MKKYIAIISILVLIIIIITCVYVYKIKKIPKEAIPPAEELPAPAPEEVPAEIPEAPAVVSIKLTADKQMIPNEIKLKLGTTVVWTNEDKYPHNLMIYDKSDPNLQEKNIIRSQNFYQGESFNYTFNKRGTFIVKDVYSSPMRGTITASVVAELEPLETIIVE